MATFSKCRILNDNNQGATDCESGLSKTTYSVYIHSKTRQGYTSSQYHLTSIPSIHSGRYQYENHH